MPILVFQHHRDETTGRLGQTLRDQGHRLQIVRLDAGDPLPTDLDEVDGLITMGGPMNVDQTAIHPWIDGQCALIKQAHEAGIPIVGVCLGAQLIAKALGGTVGPMGQPEVGIGPIRAGFPGTIDALHAGIPWTWDVIHLHGQAVTELPPKAVPLAGSVACKTQSFKVGLSTYAFQYHFEWTAEQTRAIFAGAREWLTPLGIDPDAALDSLDEKYERHRLSAQTLVRNIAQCLFPLDKRLPNDGRPVENYHAS